MPFWRRSDPEPEPDWYGIAVRANEECQRIDAVCRNLIQQNDALLSALKQMRDEVDRGLRALVKEHQDDYARMAASIDVVRGLATGARGGRPPREERLAEQQALELGRRVIAACATPEGALQLAAEITAGAGVAPNGAALQAPMRGAVSPV